MTLVQLTTTGVVDPEESHDTVYNEETVFVANEELGNLVQELHLVLRVDGTSIRDVVLRCYLSVRKKTFIKSALTRLWIEAEALSDLGNPLWSESAFSICESWSGKLSTFTLNLPM